MIRGHIEDRLARPEHSLVYVCFRFYHLVHFVHRISTERACASRPSTRASVVIVGASSARAEGERSCTAISFTKSADDSPPRSLAAPPVGSTWLGPAA